MGGRRSSHPDYYTLGIGGLSKRDRDQFATADLPPREGYKPEEQEIKSAPIAEDYADIKRRMKGGL